MHLLHPYAFLLLAAAHGHDTLALSPRAEPANQPHGYAPQIGSCPSNTPSVRAASSLSPDETAWLSTRRNATIDPMRNLLSRMNITGLDVNQYLQKTNALPNIGIAVSGGGYRAMLNGAGVLAAFDNRTINSTMSGHLGGLLQSATYLSSLSGGGWLVGSLYSNNFTSVQNIINQAANANNDLWQLSNSIFEGPSSQSQFLGTAGYYAEVVEQVKAKSDAGFNVTITDYWGRTLSYQLINATDGGPDYTFSSIASQDWFTSGTAPLPILVSDGRAPGETIISSNSTVFEFNPWELGTFDPTTFAFSPLKYIGTSYSAGSPRSSDSCVTGFDSASFVMGTSSSLFNAILTTVNGTNTTGLLSNALQKGIEDVLSKLGQSDNDIANYPNPFYQYHNDTNPAASSVQLTLVDGGEDGQNIPFNPLIQPLRQVDVIFAVDSSADTNKTNPVDGSAPGWPDGTSIIATYERSLTQIGNGTAFPAVPDTKSFFNLGLADKPAFFGCDASNITGTAPLIVYMPNGPYVYDSNTSTYDLSYPAAQRNAIINNAYNMATQGNGSLDSSWTTCVGCAILSRSFDRTHTTVPDVCKTCFSRYCWNGTTDSRTPQVYQPSIKLSQAQLNSTTTGAATRDIGTTGTLLALFAFSVLLSFFV